MFYKLLRYFQGHNIIFSVKRNKIVVFINSPGLVFAIIDVSKQDDCLMIRDKILTPNGQRAETKWPG